MNFYHAYYRAKYYDKYFDVWQTSHGQKNIIVIASDYNEAVMKINKCLSKLETDEYRVFLGEVVECIGINGVQTSESFQLRPIAKG